MIDIIINEFGGKKSREILLHILTEIKELREDFSSFKLETMAQLSDINASLDALDAAVAAIPAAGTPGGISETDADGIKSRIDAATTALQGKVTPAPAPAP